MALYNYDQMRGIITGKELLYDYETQEYRDYEPGQSAQQRGVLGRWIPARPVECNCWRHRLQRLRHAWGVLVGRYDAYDWAPIDEERNV